MLSSSKEKILQSNIVQPNNSNCLPQEIESHRTIQSSEHTEHTFFRTYLNFQLHYKKLQLLREQIASI